MKPNESLASRRETPFTHKSDCSNTGDEFEMWMVEKWSQSLPNQTALILLDHMMDELT